MNNSKAGSLQLCEPRPKRSGLTFAGFLLVTFSGIATSAITVTDGPINPPYPGASPDPWNAGATLDLDESTLTIDSGSQVGATTLFIDGRVLLNSGGLLDVDTTTLLTGAAGSASGAAFHLDAATVNAGTFSVEDDVVLYVGVEGGGLFTTDAAGGIGSSSTTVISLDDASQFLAVGNTAFGGDASSFSLGPDPADSSGFAPTLASVTSLVTTAKAQVADSAMASVTAAIGGSNLAGAGNDTVFRVTGDMAIGGAGSDALLHINDNSTFDVTGALTAPGDNSIFNLAVVDSDFDVGASANLMNGDTASVTVFLARSEFDIGADLASGSAASSNLTFTAIDTPLNVTGAVQLQYGDNTAEEITLNNSPLTTGGDFLVGTVAGVNSALSVTSTDSDVSVGGNVLLSVGASSVMSVSFSEAGVSTTGDFQIGNAGDDSTTVFDAEGTDFTAGGSVIFERVGANNSSTVQIEDAVIDVAGDFQITRTGGGLSDSTLLLDTVSGTIGQDFNFVAGVTDAVNQHVLAFLNLNIGRDLNITYTETADPGEDEAWFLGGSTLAVVRDFVVGSFVSAQVADTNIDVGGVLQVDGELVPNNLALTGDLNVGSGGALLLRVPGAGMSGQSITLSGDIALDAASTVVLELAGTTPNTSFEPIVHTGANPVVLSGDLQLAFPDGMPVGALSGQEIPLISSSMPITGSFQNVMVGEPVPTAGGPSAFVLIASGDGSSLFLRAGVASIPTMGPFGLLLLIALMGGVAGTRMSAGRRK